MVPALVVHGPVETWKSRLADYTLSWFGSGSEFSRLCGLNEITECAFGLSAKRYSLPTIVHDAEKVKVIRQLIESTAEGRAIVNKGTTRRGQTPASSIMFTMNNDVLDNLTLSDNSDKS